MGKREDSYNRRRLRMAYISSVMTMTMVLFVLGLLGGIAFSAQKLSQHVRENLRLQVILQEGISDAAALQTANEIGAEPYVKEAKLISPDEALEEFRQLYGDNPMDLLDENPLPPSIELTLNADYANNDSISMIEAGMLGNESYGAGIKNIQKDVNLVEDVNKNIEKIWYVLVGICLVLMLIMLALINNTIRLAIYSKRFLIKTMQLVGATGSFIKQPFIRSGLLQGFISGMLAIAALAVVVFWAQSKLPDIFSREDFGVFALIFLSVMAIGMLISFISTSFAVRKFLRLKMDDLY